MQRTDNKKQILRKEEFLQSVDKAYPNLSQRQIGYILGVAEAVADRQDEREREKKAEKETA